MNNIFLIARREYLERVRSRAFVIMTFFIPALMFGVTVLPSLLMTRGTSETKRMVVVAADRDTAEMIRSRIERQQDQPDKAATPAPKKRGLLATHFTVEVSTDATQEGRAALTEKVKQKQLDGFLWATPDAIAARKLDFVTRDTSSFIENGILGQTVSDALRRHTLKSKGLKEDEIDAALQPVDVEPVSPLGKDAPNPLIMFYATLGMVMVMYMTVLLYGINVMRSILEEKTSRIMEVMLSTATAKEMMAGKILGVGAVGLTQVAIWLGTVVITSAGTLIAARGVLKNVVSPSLLIYFGVFFLLGYTLYSTLCAAVGSMVNSEQEAQQMQFLVMMPMILSVIFIVNIFQHPNSSIAVFGSLFPFTAPLVMFSRIAMMGANPPPFWQIGLSIALMIATIYGMIWLCGRIYRVGILMYGKKPNLPEILKWIKYA
ncbi:MAG TPA: ABC transporter permease [Candidatus Sulfotelmatobacter sp.]|nr:ABC transporter permease [Candidatus Sulfotelmatobacter sp.]